MTTMKNVILAAALGLASMTFASAKTYQVVLNAPTQVGVSQLAAGTYAMSLDLNRSVAVFTNVETGKKQMVLVHSTDSNVDYNHTAIDLKKQDGTQRIDAIELEGSNDKVEF
jgi:hypothetical protein